ncbi:hypothetical protein ABZ352_10795 [Streptomyces griseofuscus]|uniref:hypothetical protein n=1 Tax=Streptomyces griseofuscus TaxID=146922 RepID=UPI00340E371A
MATTPLALVDLFAAAPHIGRPLGDAPGGRRGGVLPDRRRPGRWHRVRLDAPSDLMSLTLRQGTRHERIEGQGEHAE